MTASPQGEAEGNSSGRCVATFPLRGEAVTPHLSPALRETAADSFSSRRSRRQLIRPLRSHLSALRREGDDTSSVMRRTVTRRMPPSPQGEGRGGTSRTPSPTARKALAARLNFAFRRALSLDFAEAGCYTQFVRKPKKTVLYFWAGCIICRQSQSILVG